MSATSITLNATIASPTDIISCSITATDTDGETETSTASISVENSTPVINSISITPNNPTSSTQVTCQVNWSDADGEALSPSYVWTNVASGVQLGTTASITLDPAFVQPSEQSPVSSIYQITMAPQYPVNNSLSHLAPEISAVTITSSTTPVYNDSDLGIILLSRRPRSRGSYHLAKYNPRNNNPLVQRSLDLLWEFHQSH